MILSLAHLDEQLAGIRELAHKSRRSGEKSFNAFRDLISALLHQTVAKSSAVISLTDTSLHPREAVIGGVPEPTDGIPLNNGHFLRVNMSLSLERDHLKIRKASYQYQLDKIGSEWFFRYDFVRNHPAGNPYPPSHYQINAKFLSAKHLAKDCPKVHFTTPRTSLENFIRMLVIEFNVKCRERYWEKILTESERLFQGSRSRS